jgi:hypothetical protein
MRLSLFLTSRGGWIGKIHQHKLAVGISGPDTYVLLIKEPTPIKVTPGLVIVFTGINLTAYEGIVSPWSILYNSPGDLGIDQADPEALTALGVGYDELAHELWLLETALKAGRKAIWAVELVARNLGKEVNHEHRLIRLLLLLVKDWY